MATDEFLDRLAVDLRPAKPRRVGRDLAILGAVGATELAAWLLGGFMRADFSVAAARPMLWWKLTSLALLAAIAAITTVRSFAPDRSPRIGLVWTGAAIAVAALAGLGLDLALDFPGGATARLDWPHGAQCVAKMVALSIPPAVALWALARGRAPTQPDGTALAAAIAAAGWGAFVFAFACPSDDPLYITTWYAVGCGAVALVGREMLRRAIHW